MRFIRGLKLSLFLISYNVVWKCMASYLHMKITIHSYFDCFSDRNVLQMIQIIMLFWMLIWKQKKTYFPPPQLVCYHSARLLLSLMRFIAFPLYMAIIPTFCKCNSGQVVWEHNIWLWMFLILESNSPVYFCYLRSTIS